MEHLPLISVIVPVYKVEAYLDKCISSIAAQTYPNWELILVDDGSPDRSGEICDAWAAKDCRIRVIHQENAGGGAARNAALDDSRGDLIAFVDSDDYIAPDMFEHLFGLLHNADIAECGHIDVTDDHGVFGGGSGVHTYTGAEAMEAHIHNRIFRQLIWNKLYRREVVGGIRFPTDKKIDDEFFTYQVLGNAKTLVRSERICYAYRQQGGSVMHSMDPRKRLEAVEAKLQRHLYIKENFRALAGLSANDLWFTCIYQGQLSLRTLPPEASDAAFAYLENILRQHPCDPAAGTLKEKLWLSLARISLRGLCRLRNALKIGL